MSRELLANVRGIISGALVTGRTSLSLRKQLRLNMLTNDSDLTRGHGICRDIFIVFLGRDTRIELYVSHRITPVFPHILSGRKLGKLVGVLE